MTRIIVDNAIRCDTMFLKTMAKKTRVIHIRAEDEEAARWEKAALLDKRRLSDWARIALNEKVEVDEPRLVGVMPGGESGE